MHRDDKPPRNQHKQCQGARQQGQHGHRLCCCRINGRRRNDVGGPRQKGVDGRHRNQRHVKLRPANLPAHDLTRGLLRVTQRGDRQVCPKFHMPRSCAMLPPIQNQKNTTHQIRPTTCNSSPGPTKPAVSPCKRIKGVDARRAQKSANRAPKALPLPRKTRPIRRATNAMPYISNGAMITQAMRVPPKSMSSSWPVKCASRDRRGNCAMKMMMHALIKYMSARSSR
mmetsp:Transcript_18144/g.28192  ORF Transcript_18144/g.28192 Transcript_18144/m.28192 type:complete len:226 (-) Transcript_18144:1925-2602(-)